MTSEARIEANRRNAKKSTGPRTEAGKRKSSQNALKHGLTAVTAAPPAAPGEVEGEYQERLAFWVDDLKPCNVLELAMVERACRSTWKLDRCARYEAAAANRRADGKPDEDTAGRARHHAARKLGVLLMYKLDHGPFPQFEPRPPGTLDLYDDAPGTYRALCAFQEGVEWLLDEWDHLLP